MAHFRKDGFKVRTGFRHLDGFLEAYGYSTDHNNNKVENWANYVDIFLWIEER